MDSVEALEIALHHMCLGVSDVGLKPLVGLGKLDSLIVEDCIQISEKGVQGAARYVSYRQNLSWMVLNNALSLISMLQITSYAKMCLGGVKYYGSLVNCT